MSYPEVNDNNKKETDSEWQERGVKVSKEADGSLMIVEEILIEGFLNGLGRVEE